MDPDEKRLDVSQLGAQPTRARRGRPDKGGNPISRFFGAIGAFVAQVLDELRKVVRPTRSELIQYTGIVLVFVVIMMSFTAGLDWVLTRGMLWLFGG